MKFENAYSGVKKIFTAEILMLISAVAIGVASIFGVVTLGAIELDSEVGAGVFGLLAAILLIGGAVVAIIAFILNIVGVSKASIDDGGFKTALAFIFVTIVLYIVMAIFQSFNSTIAGICQAVAKVTELCVTLFIIQGIINLSDRLNNPEMSRKGTNIFKVIMAIYILVIISSILVIIFQANPVTATIALVLTIVAMVLSIVKYFMFLTYLAKAKKMLA